MSQTRKGEKTGQNGYLRVSLFLYPRAAADNMFIKALHVCVCMYMSIYLPLFSIDMYDYVLAYGQEYVNT